MPEAIRNAEKTRISTCAFADRVATCALDTYVRYRGSLTHEDVQTVLSAFLAYDSKGDNLQVLSQFHISHFSLKLFEYIISELVQSDHSVHPAHGRVIDPLHM